MNNCSENKEQSKQNLNNLKVKQVDRTSIESSDSNIILVSYGLSDIESSKTFIYTYNGRRRARVKKYQKIIHESR